MKIADVIDKADRWQPNVFDLKDKLDWCYEVTRDLMLDNPEFLSATKTVASDGGIVPLPEGVLYSDVAEVYVNGARVERLDERTMEDAQLKRGDQVYVVYRYFPPVYALSDDGEVPEDLETVCILIMCVPRRRFSRMTQRSITSLSLLITPSFMPIRIFAGRILR